MKSDVKLPSERSFGLVFAAVFAVMGLWSLVVRSESPRWWAVGIATIFLVLGLAQSRVLRPLNWVWYKIGLALHHIVNPIIMGLIYFGAVVPMGLVMRLTRRDQLGLKKRAETYWMVRDAPAPRPGSMSKQF